MTRNLPSGPEDGNYQMHKLLKFLGAHLAFGAAAGVAMALVVATSDVGGMRTLLAGDENPYLAVFILSVMFGLTFGSFAMGIAVMTLPWEKNPDGQ